MADVPLNYMTQMSQIPQNHMPVTYEVPLNQMPQMSQVPRNQMPLGPKPCTTTCPSCGTSIVTAVEMKPSMQTHLVALLLCCCCSLFACVPYCMDSCQNTLHYCPECDAYLGIFYR